MPRLASAIAWIGAAAWLAAVAGGFAFLLRYKNTPGQAGGAAPELWPAGSAIARTAGRATLLLFAHPRCVCTRASLAELNKMMASFQGRLDAKVLFWMPRDAPADWSSGDLWTSAAHIPGVAVTRDEDGREASRFGVATSGGVVLYDGSGRLLFQGGITQSRGHEGDSFGEERIVSLLTTGAADRADAPVFGCALNQEPPVRVARAGATSTQKEGEK
ncbi:MAG TPA: RedB protein [Myxococcales bacterium]|nr:RedB protein [Myxococcales bacterium]